MVIYEVNLTVNKTVYGDFKVWLQQHIQQMLNFNGFMRAEVAEVELAGFATNPQISVRYWLDSRENLQNYLEQYAPDMRAEGVKLFSNNFTAERRILQEISI